MIQLTDVFGVLLKYRWAINFWLQEAADSIVRDPIKRRALYKQLFQSQFYKCWKQIINDAQSNLCTATILSPPKFVAIVDK
jgi:hypothetical protein